MTNFIEVDAGMLCNIIIGFYMSIIRRKKTQAQKENKRFFDQIKIIRNGLTPTRST